MIMSSANQITKISYDLASDWTNFFNHPPISTDHWIEIDVPYMAMVGAGDFYLGQISSNIENAQFSFNGWDSDILSVEENNRLILNGPFTGGFSDYDHNFAVTATGENGELVTTRFNMSITDRPDPEYFLLENEFIVYSSDVSMRDWNDYYKILEFPVGYDYDVNEIDPSIIVVPASWIHMDALPQLTHGPIKANISLGYGVKDINQSDNPSYIEGASGSLKAEFEKLVLDAIELGAAEIEVAQWTYASIDEDGSHFILPFDFTPIPLQYSDLNHLSNFASELGIEVLVQQQIQGYNNLVLEMNAENVQEFMNAYKTHIIKNAKIYESMGISKMDISCPSGIFNFSFDSNREFDGIYLQSYREIIEEVSEIFSGKIVFLDSFLLDDQLIANEIDEVVVELGLDFSGDQYLDTHISAEMISEYIIQSGKLERIESLGSNFDKVIVTLMVQSRHDALTDPKYMEESECNLIFEQDNEGNLLKISDCMQLQKEVDFAMQANAYHGVMLALNTLDTEADITFIPRGNHVTENVLGSNLFPNLGAGSRNKPAEDVLYNWFGSPILVEFLVVNEQFVIELDLNTAISDPNNVFSFNLDFSNTQMAPTYVEGTENQNYKLYEQVIEFYDVNFRDDKILITTNATDTMLGALDCLQLKGLKVNGEDTKNHDIIINSQPIVDMLEFSATTISGKILNEIRISGNHEFGEFRSNFISEDLHIDGYHNLKVSVAASKEFSHADEAKIITSADALDALRMSVGLEPQAGLVSKVQFIAADFNRDGRVTSADALEILKYSVGLETQQQAEWVFIDSNTDLNSVNKSSINYDNDIVFQSASVLGAMDTMGILIGDVNDSYSGLVA